MSKISVWKAYRKNLPTVSSELPIDRQREMLFAIAGSMEACLGSNPLSLPGWSYTNSVTLGEASPGTASQPARIYSSYGSGGTKIIIKTVRTYNGSGRVTKRALYFSDNNGTNYVPLTDEDGNYVHNITYDGSNNVTQATWSKTP